MIVVDTSVWIDHLHAREEHLEFLLKRKRIAVHPFVIGEIALGTMKHYDAIIESLSILPSAMMASNAEVLFTIKQESLMGSGIGYVDTHLLASVKLMPNARLWTRDKRLSKVAETLGVAYHPQAAA